MGSSLTFRDQGHRNDEMVKLYVEEGLTIQQLASRFNLVTAYVRRIINGRLTERKVNQIKRREFRELEPETHQSLQQEAERLRVENTALRTQVGMLQGLLNEAEAQIESYRSKGVPWSHPFSHQAQTIHTRTSPVS